MTSRKTTKKITMNREELSRILKALGIRSLEGDDLDSFLDEAEGNRWSPRETVHQLAERELLERERRSLEWRLRDSKIMNRDFKPMTNFDWGWPDKIDRSIIESILDADFVERGDNIVLIGSLESNHPLEINVARHAKSVGAYSTAFCPFGADGDTSGVQTFKEVDAAFNNYSDESGGVLDIKGFDKKVCPLTGLTGNMIHWMV